MEKYKLLNDVKAYYKVEDNLYIELTKEEFYMELHKLNERLQKRIDKAIKYIEWNLDVNEEVIEYINFDGNFKKVLDILKGSDK